MVWQQCRVLGIILFLGNSPLSFDIKIKECSHNTRNTLEEAYGLSRGQENSICLILAGNATASMWKSRSVSEKRLNCKESQASIQLCKAARRAKYSSCKSDYLLFYQKKSGEKVYVHMQKGLCVRLLRHNDLILESQRVNLDV